MSAVELTTKFDNRDHSSLVTAQDFTEMCGELGISPTIADYMWREKPDFVTPRFDTVCMFLEMVIDSKKVAHLELLEALGVPLTEAD